MKLCKDCRLEKSRSDFPKHGGRVCRLCVNARSRRRHLIVDDNGQTYMQRYRNTPEGKSNRERYNTKLKVEVLTNYSPTGIPTCSCCGELEQIFLAIDHIVPVKGGFNNLLDKQGRPRAGRSLYRWLRKNNFPEGFRTLCHNCNFGRELNGGVCPHEKKRNANAA